jgi:hypothetical protein
VDEAATDEALTNEGPTDHAQTAHMTDTTEAATSHGHG